jgi:hypothetical protein
MSNKTKIIIGLIFIIAAFVCVGGILYVSGQSQQQNEAQMAQLQAQLVNLISQKARAALPRPDVQKVQRDIINVEELIAKASRLYGAEERERKDGVLWIDKEGKRCIITLGAVNGLRKGSILNVYREDRFIDKITVDTPFDIISYVTPIERSLEQFDDNYYRVVVSR